MLSVGMLRLGATAKTARRAPQLAAQGAAWPRTGPKTLCLLLYTLYFRCAEDRPQDCILYTSSFYFRCAEDRPRDSAAPCSALGSALDELKQLQRSVDGMYSELERVGQLQSLLGQLQLGALPILP